MIEIVEIINSNPKLILNKSDENIKTNLWLFDIFRASNTILCSQSAVEMAEIYWKHSFAVDELLTREDELPLVKMILRKSFLDTLSNVIHWRKSTVWMGKTGAAWRCAWMPSKTKEVLISVILEKNQTWFILKSGSRMRMFHSSPDWEIYFRWVKSSGVLKLIIMGDMHQAVCIFCLGVFIRAW